MHREMVANMSPQEREMYFMMKRGVAGIQATAAAVAGGGPSDLGRCQPPQMPRTLGPDGCPTDDVYCRTPIPVNETIAALGVPTSFDVETNAEKAYLFELRTFTVPAAAATGTVLITSLKVGAREFFPDGPVPVENFALDYRGANLLPQKVKITSAIPAKVGVAVALDAAR